MLDGTNLTGITRDTVIALAGDLGIPVREQPVPRELLYMSDEIFFTGTAAEVTPVRKVDHHTIGEGTRGPVTAALQEAFFDVIHRGNDPYGWLTPVPRTESVTQ